MLDEAHIVGCHQRRTELVGQGHGGVHVLFITGTVGTLQFDVETLGEHAQPVAQQRLGFVAPAGHQGLADIAFLACGQGNQPLAGRSDPVTLENHQAIALAVGPAARNQLGKVTVTRRVHGQEAEARQRCLRVGTGQPQVGTADRLDPGTHGGLVELHQRAHVALVSDRHRRHVHSSQRLGQRFDPHQAVDQREFGVDAQVNEGNRHGESCSSAERQGRDCSVNA